MRRVAITGMGIVSSIGANVEEVAQSLREARSGIVRADDYARLGFRCQVHAAPNVDIEKAVPRRARRFMGQGGAWNYIAMEEAIKDAGLEESAVSHERTGLVMSSGGPSTKTLIESADTTRNPDKGPRKVSPFAVPKSMSSAHAASLGVAFKIRGVSYCISSACSTSAHSIGHGAELIQWGKQDIVFAGGGEDLDWSLSVLFDAMGAMSSAYNETPAIASRPYDTKRDGFVIAGGAGVLVLEDWERAKKRGARIYAELVGYGANADGDDMVQPSGEGAVRCMKLALADVKAPLDYINPHATSTPIGDVREIEAMREMFGADMPPLSATKALSGHSLGAAGAQEAIYTLIMMRDGFICKSAHIDELDPACEGAPIVREMREVKINHAMSNSFGFGGTNATLVFKKVEGA